MLHAEIRLMTGDDVDAVRRLDSVAFGPYRPPGAGVAAAPVRSAANVSWNLSKDPQGCFVAEDAGSVVGYIFSRCWGAVGWSGTFGVDPRYRGKGAGKALLDRSRRYLAERGCRFVGLETMPDSLYNLGFYLRCGYRPAGLTLRWSKELGGAAVKGSGGAAGAEGCLTSHWASGEPARGRWVGQVRALGQRILPGLDLVGECHHMLEQAQGDLLLLNAGETLAGAGLVRIAPLFEDVLDEACYVEFLTLSPGTPFGAALDQVVSQLLMRGRSAVTIPANSAEADVADALLQGGYRVAGANVRFLSSEPPRLAGTVCWRWAG